MKHHQSEQTAFDFDASGPDLPSPLLAVIGENVPAPMIEASYEAQAPEEELSEEDLAHRRNLAMLRELLDVRVFNTVTGAAYKGEYRKQRWADPSCSEAMERYHQRVKDVHDESALQEVTEAFLSECTGARQ